jgi:hypothetical protein
VTGRAGVEGVRWLRADPRLRRAHVLRAVTPQAARDRLRCRRADVRVVVQEPPGQGAAGLSGETFLKRASRRPGEPGMPGWWSRQARELVGSRSGGPIATAQS